MKKFLILVGIVVAAYLGVDQYPGLFQRDVAVTNVGGSGNTALSEAFSSHTSDVQVTGTGVVVKVLPDDVKGSRHQRFIIRLESGQTLLIAHNIDIAPRVAALHEGDKISFKGEYEWNAKGGVVHWTHHDPGGRHPSGWLRHGGHTYQ